MESLLASNEEKVGKPVHYPTAVVTVSLMSSWRSEGALISPITITGPTYRGADRSAGTVQKDEGSSGSHAR